MNLRSILNPFHGMTARDRIAQVCRYSLEKGLVRFRPRVPARSANYVYRSMVSAGSLSQGIISLASLAACSESMPKIELCVDESIRPEDVVVAFSACGFTVDAITHLELPRLLEGVSGAGSLQMFAQAFFWGRKTAFTFGNSGGLPVLYSDLDVLWFQDPAIGLKIFEVSSLLGVEDCAASIDVAVLTYLGVADRELVRSAPFVCAGIYVVAPGFTPPAMLLNTIDCILGQGTPGYFAEQTLLSLVVKHYGTQVPYNCLPTCPSPSVLRPSYSDKCWIAAHYAGPTRPQFWRDAWSLLPLNLFS